MISSITIVFVALPPLLPHLDIVFLKSTTMLVASLTLILSPQFVTMVKEREGGMGRGRRERRSRNLRSWLKIFRSGSIHSKKDFYLTK